MQAAIELRLVVVTFFALILGGCAVFHQPNAGPSEPEKIASYSVLTYQLPFVFEEGQPRQEAFLNIVRGTVAPADWENGPDSMTAIAHMLVVSTIAENHLRLKRFFDSLPDRPEDDQETWRTDLAEPGADGK